MKLEPVLRLKVSKLFSTVNSTRVLAGVNFQLNRGEWLGLLGKNGSGKSSLINCLSGVYPITDGLVELDGKLLNKLPIAEIASLGLRRTTQKSVIFPELTAAEHLCLNSFSLHSLKELTQTPSVKTTIELFEMSDWQNKIGLDLSPAEKKIVDVARHVASFPKVLVLDEPFAGLSCTEKLRLSVLLKKVAKGYPEMSVILVDHNLDLVNQLCNLTLWMAEGRITGDPNATYT